MVVHKEVIQNIRLKKQLAALREQFAQSDALREELLALSGLLDKGLDPRQVPATHQAVQDLLKLAEQIEAQELPIDPSPHRTQGRIQV